ncbi:GerMN domain-containing protein [Actinoplanes auranticolor]|uniref:GerMN domain-containing protein n=1 Tax=Actinoplanes auranticolor TaxID=47988 RepID=UPI001FEB6E31|nr:GerMN domain-containing protein [Actinoplanes auranticolor]
MNRRLVHLLVISLLSLAGCGVRSEAEPRDFDPPPGPQPIIVTSTPSTPAGGTDAEPLYFVRTDRLVAVIRRIRAAPTVQQQMEHLLAGPTEAERLAGLSSTLNGNIDVEGVSLTAGRATVAVGDDSDLSGRTDDVLAFGQIVCTLTARPDVATVSFQSDGETLGVPRADGQLSTSGLTAADYTALTAPA